MASHAEMAKLEQAARLAEVRATLYDFFGEQLIERPVREDQSEEALLQRWKSIAEVLDSSPARDIVAHLSSEDFSGHALNGEFSELFAVPTGRYLAPVESVYLGARVRGEHWEAGMLRGQPWMRVTECYRRAGYVTPPQSGFESDHLASELQFLAVLCRAEQQAWLQGDFEATREFRMMQREFIADHPLAWIDSLRSRFARVSRDLYYDNLLGLINAHLQTEWEHLRDE